MGLPADRGCGLGGSSPETSPDALGNCWRVILAPVPFRSVLEKTILSARKKYWCSAASSSLPLAAGTPAATRGKTYRLYFSRARGSPSADAPPPVPSDGTYRGLERYLRSSPYGRRTMSILLIHVLGGLLADSSHQFLVASLLASGIALIM